MDSKRGADAVSANFTNLSNYYLGGQHLLSFKQELLRQLGLLAVSISGGSLYFVLAANFASDPEAEYLDLGNLTANQFNCGLGVALTALAVLYNATDIFFSQKHNEEIPASLETLVTPPTTGLKTHIFNGFILLGSMASAFPLMMISIFYPLPIESPAFKILQAMVVEIDNTILHFLPLKLALTYPIYRLPALPIEYCIKRFILKEQLVVKDEAVESMRSKLLSFLQNVQRNLPLYNKFNEGRLCYDWDNTLPEFKWDGHTDLLASLRQAFPGDLTQGFKQHSKFSDYLSKASGLLGVGWVTGSLAGYLIAPILEIYEWTGSKTGTFFLTVAPVYFLAVLFSFFGYNIGKTIYYNLTSWGKNDIKLPFEFRLAPKTFLGIMVLNVWLNIYGYAAAEELIHDWVPKDSTVLTSLLIGFCRTGLPLLGLFSIKELAQTLIRKWMIYFGSGNEQRAARLMTTLDQFVAAIEMTNPEVIKSAQTVLTELNISLLPASEEECIEENFSDKEESSISSSETSTMSSSGSSSSPTLSRPLAWCRWFYDKCFGSREQPLLGSQGGSPTYSAMAPVGGNNER